MSDAVEKSYGGAPHAEGGISQVEDASNLDEKAQIAQYKAAAIEAENAEHDMGVLEAVQAYPMAATWAFVMSCTIIMEAYCVFLMGNFIALPAFAEDYGAYDVEKKKWVIAASWQSALQMGGPVGAIIGVCLAGPLTSRIGYRWATITGLMLLNAFIFVFYFAKSLPVMFASQLLEGIPWGIFIANAPAYCSEITPIQLRAPATQMLQMFWAIGAIIVGGITFHYNSRLDDSAYRIPIALQWMFPTPLAILLYMAPESPWWLVRKGRLEEAEHAVGRLGRKSRLNLSEAVAMMRRTIELEKSVKEPNHLELFKGTDLYRTLIVCGVYAAQNLTGNLIANQAVYFFEQAGMSTNTAFAMGLITSALQWVFVMLSWILTSYLGRRTIYVWGSLINVGFLIALGIAGSVGTSDAASLAQASLGLIVSVLFTLGPAPASWVIIGETSAIRLRPLTTGIGRASYYIVNIPCIFLASYMLNPQEANLGGKGGGERSIMHRPVLKGIYASEGWFMKLLEADKTFVTKNPKEANLFYLPFSSKMLQEKLYITGSQSHDNLIQYLKGYVDLIAARHPFWNRTGGADHFLVACHDWAPVETKQHMHKCIRALCNANIKDGFVFGKDVSLPETIVHSPKNLLKYMGGKPPSERSNLAFYAGRMHGYVRPVLLQYWGDNDPDMKIYGRMPGRKGKFDYLQLMKSSKYCICPKGFEVNSPRVVEAIFYECVPVIISDNFIPPFFDVLNWESFAIFVLEKDIPNLKNILLSIPEEKYLEMQMRVKKVQQHFLWHAKPIKYDIFHMILHSIWYNRMLQIRPT